MCFVQASLVPWDMHDDVIKWKNFQRYCTGNSPVSCEFPSQRPVTRSFDVFYDLPLNKRSSKQSRRRWFEMPSRSLWRNHNGCNCIPLGIFTITLTSYERQPLVQQGAYVKYKEHVKAVALCEWNPSVIGDFPHKWPAMRKMFPYHGAIMKNFSLTIRGRFKVKYVYICNIVTGSTFFARSLVTVRCIELRTPIAFIIFVIPFYVTLLELWIYISLLLLSIW